MSKLLEQINTAEKKSYLIKDLGRVVTGKTPSKNNPEDWGDEIDFITPTDFSSDGKYLSGVKRKISTQGKSRYKNMIVPSESVVVTCIGSDMGKVVVSKEESLTNQQINSIVVNQDSFDVDFAYYVLKAMYPTLRSIAEEGGSTMPIITKSVFEKIEFEAPSLPTQKKITSILSAYDAKIENNNLIVKKLEDTAQTLFNEWFVNFKFPGYKKVKFVDSEMGEIPEGWEVGKISDFGSVVCGKTPSKSNSEYFGGNIPFIKIPDMHGQVFINKTEDSLTEAGENTQKNKTVPAGSICVSCIATVGLVSITTQDSQTNQQINTLVPNSKDFLEYLYFTLVDMKSDLQAIGSGGSTTLNVNTSVFSGLEVLIPTTDSVTKFHKVVSRMFNQIKHLTTENVSLKSQRDQLLAKLI